jgi:hypothetical protein
MATVGIDPTFVKMQHLVPHQLYERQNKRDVVKRCVSIRATTVPTMANVHIVEWHILRVRCAPLYWSRLSFVFSKSKSKLNLVGQIGCKHISKYDTPANPNTQGCAYQLLLPPPMVHGTQPSMGAPVPALL